MKKTKKINLLKTLKNLLNLKNDKKVNKYKMKSFVSSIFQSRIKFFNKKNRIFKILINSFSKIKQKFFFSKNMESKRKSKNNRRKKIISLKNIEQRQKPGKIYELFLYDSFPFVERKLMIFSTNLIKKKFLLNLIKFLNFLSKDKIYSSKNFSKKKNLIKFLPTFHSKYCYEKNGKRKKICRSKFTGRRIKKKIFSIKKLETVFFLCFKKLIIQKKSYTFLFLLNTFIKKGHRKG